MNGGLTLFTPSNANNSHEIPDITPMEHIFDYIKTLAWDQMPNFRIIGELVDAIAARAINAVHLEDCPWEEIASLHFTDE